MQVMLMTAKEARDMAAEFRMNASIQKAITAIEKEITTAVIKGCTSITTRVITDIRKGKEIELIISALKSVGYRVEKKTLKSTQDPYYGQEEVIHSISWE